jgi:uncharacterized protein (DUF169 family)
VKKFVGTQPSGCSFWRLATEGRTFYTTPENHFNCAVGPYTHNGAFAGARKRNGTACMAPPASLEFGAIASLGCIGNRVYTGLKEEEMYVVLRGRDPASVAEALRVISGANAALRDYARGRREQLSHSEFSGR